MTIAIIVITTVVAIILNILINQLGIAFAKKRSGYEFKEFAFFRFNWKKGQDGKTKFSYISRKDSKFDRLYIYKNIWSPPKNIADFKYKFIYIGGAIANIVFAVPFAVLMFLPVPDLVKSVGLGFTIVGVSAFFLNIIPHSANLARETKDLNKNPALIAPYFYQFHFSVFYHSGGRIMDAPAEWFDLSSIKDEYGKFKVDPNHPIIALVRNNRSWRFFLEGRFEEALSEIYSIDYSVLTPMLGAKFFLEKLFLTAVCLKRFDEANKILVLTQYSPNVQSCVNYMLKKKIVEFYPYQMAERFARKDFESAKRITQEFAEKLHEIKEDNQREEMGAYLKIMSNE